MEAIKTQSVEKRILSCYENYYKGSQVKTEKARVKKELSESLTRTVATQSKQKFM